MHNYDNDLLINILNTYKFKTILELHIRTQIGLRKPTNWHTEKILFILYIRRFQPIQ